MAKRTYNWSTSEDYRQEINNRIRERDALPSPGNFSLKYLGEEEDINNKLRNDYYSKQADLNTAVNDYRNAIYNGVDLSNNRNYQQEYKNYVNDYTRRGERAMKDTLGKLASRTGGLASSYASAVAQQAYSNYMDELANKMNDLSNSYRSQTISGLENIRDFLQGDKTREQSTLISALNNYLNMDNARKGEWQANYDKYKTDISLIDQLIQELAGQRSTSLSKEQEEERLALEREKMAQRAVSGSGGSGGKNSSSGSNNSSSSESDRIWVDGTAFGLSELLRGEAEGWFTRDANGNWISVPKYDSRGFRLTNPYTGR